MGHIFLLPLLDYACVVIFYWILIILKLSNVWIFISLKSIKD